MKTFVSILCLFCTINMFSQNSDIVLLKKINLNRNKNLDQTFNAISDSAAGVAYSIPVIIFGIGLFIKNITLKRKGIFLGVSMLTSAIVSNIVKYSVERSRPFETYSILQNIGEGGSPSFPSGHTSDAFAIATALSIAYPKWYIIVLCYSWACMVGFSRLHLGVHYPSDVLGGAIIGTGSVYLCYKVFQIIGKRA